MWLINPEIQFSKNTVLYRMMFCCLWIFLAFTAFSSNIESDFGIKSFTIYGQTNFNRTFIVITCLGKDLSWRLVRWSWEWKIVIWKTISFLYKNMLVKKKKTLYIFFPDTMINHLEVIAFQFVECSNWKIKITCMQIVKTRFILISPFYKSWLLIALRN